MKTKSPSILLVDIGNSSTTLGIAVRGKVSRMDRISTPKCSKPTIKKIISSIARNTVVEGACICSVVPGITKLWVREIKDVFGVKTLLVSRKLNLGIKIDYPKPDSIGPDRIADACGAVARHGAPVIIADFGTALTFDVVAPGAKYIGGVIAPGLPFMTDYLSEKTALLPHIDLKGHCHGVGRSTEGAMKLGAEIGYRGIVREVVNYLRSDKKLKKAKLCATGGYAEWVMKGLDMPFSFDPDLTLFGLLKIYEKNV